uniref:Uncharacterized protein n=1 Tax=Tetraselmis sp. GSL018 TaxID=582737 RepID=A0A061S531_9CHLO
MRVTRFLSTPHLYCGARGGANEANTASPVPDWAAWSRPKCSAPG